MAIGSRNPAKVGACRTVFEHLGCSRVIEFSVPSGVREQPLGLEETDRGAEGRARRAQAATGARYGVGLEGGATLEPDGSVWLIGVAAVITATGEILRAEGPRMRLPPSLYEPIAAGQELGPLIDDLSGLRESKTGIGAIGWLTRGLVPRETLWVVTLACAVAPLFRSTVYTELPAPASERSYPDISGSTGSSSPI